MLLMDNHALRVMWSAVTSTVNPKNWSQFTASLMDSTAPPSQGGYFSMKPPLKGPLSSSLVSAAVAATPTARCSQERLAEQACGSPSHSQAEEQDKHIGRSHCLLTASSNVAHGAVLATATHQEFAKSPQSLRSRRTWEAKQGLWSLTCQMCKVDPPGYFLFHSLLVPYESLHVN